MTEQVWHDLQADRRAHVRWIEWLMQGVVWAMDFTEYEAVVNDLNHRIRPCPNGKTSCQAFFESGNRPTFTKPERRGIYDWVMERVERILSTTNQSGQAVRESAWSFAVESWLRSKGYIRVHINPKCRPMLPPFLAHE